MSSNDLISVGRGECCPCMSSACCQMDVTADTNCAAHFIQSHSVHISCVQQQVKQEVLVRANERITKSHARRTCGHHSITQPVHVTQHTAILQSPIPRFVKCDITDASAIKDAVTGADAVVHLAAVPDDAPFAEHLVPANVVGAGAVIEAVRATPSVRR